MDRNNGRYTFRRHERQQSHHNSPPSSAATTPTSAAATTPTTATTTNSSHDELIRFVREAWNMVNEQGTPIVDCSESDQRLKNFQPFNLEEFWGQRLVQNIQISQGQQ